MTQHGKSKSREVIERAVEAGLGSVPVAGAALAIAFVTAVNWRLDERREQGIIGLAEAVEDLRQRVDGLDLESLAGNDLFIDAVVSATRTIEHAHQEEKVSALRNAVLNSVAPDAPDADTQAITLPDRPRSTPSHLRLLTLCTIPAWFELHRLTPPQAAMAGSRTLSRSETRSRTVSCVLLRDQ
jgi:putative transposase